MNPIWITLDQPAPKEPGKYFVKRDRRQYKFCQVVSYGEAGLALFFDESDTMYDINEEQFQKAKWSKRIEFEVCP